MQDALFSVFACEGKDLQVIGSGYLLYHSPHGELQGEWDRRGNSTGQKSLRSKATPYKAINKITQVKLNA